MPPKTAIRSGMAVRPGRIGADRPVLVAGVAGVMTEGKRLHPLRQSGPQDGVGRLDQDGADVNPTVGDDAGVAAQQLPRIKAFHHLRADELLFTITPAPP